MTRERHLEEPEILATGEDEELEDEVSSPDFFWGGWCTPSMGSLHTTSV